MVDWNTQKSKEEEGLSDNGCTTAEKGTSTAEIVVILRLPIWNMCTIKMLQDECLSRKCVLHTGSLAKA